MDGWKERSDECTTLPPTSLLKPPQPISPPLSFYYTHIHTHAVTHLNREM
jgi:hypothetical protein